MRNVKSKRKFGLRIWEVVFNRELSSKDGKFPNYSNKQLLNTKPSNHCIRNSCFMYIQQGFPLSENLFNFISEKPYFNVNRNFSTSKAVYLFSTRRSQDREKIINYTCGAALSILVLFVTYLNLTVQEHQDYVYIEPDEPTEKK